MIVPHFLPSFSLFSPSDLFFPPFGRKTEILATNVMREASFPQRHGEFLPPFQCASPAGFNNNDCFLVEGGWAKRVLLYIPRGKDLGHNIYVCERERVQRERKKAGINHHPRDRVHQNNHIPTFNRVIQTDCAVQVHQSCFSVSGISSDPPRSSHDSCSHIKWSHGRAS